MCWLFWLTILYRATVIFLQVHEYPGYPADLNVDHWYIRYTPCLCCSALRFLLWVRLHRFSYKCNTRGRCLLHTWISGLLRYKRWGSDNRFIASFFFNKYITFSCTSYQNFRIVFKIKPNPNDNDCLALGV